MSPSSSMRPRATASLGECAGTSPMRNVYSAEVRPATSSRPSPSRRATSHARSASACASMSCAAPHPSACRSRSVDVVGAAGAATAGRCRTIGNAPTIDDPGSTDPACAPRIRAAMRTSTKRPSAHARATTSTAGQHDRRIDRARSRSASAHAVSRGAIASMRMRSVRAWRVRIRPNASSSPSAPARMHVARRAMRTRGSSSMSARHGRSAHEVEVSR